MDIIINTDSCVPIYEQISVHIKRMIICGQLKPGDQIPSIRLLAKQLRVGIITVQRAYEDLQKEGVLETSKGKGTYISDRSSSLMVCREEAKQDRAKSQIEIAAQNALDNNLPMETLIEIIRRIYVGGADE